MSDGSSAAEARRTQEAQREREARRNREAREALCTLARYLFVRPPRRVRGFFRSVFMYGVPAFFLSRMLLHLSGGALWLPPEWRNTVLVVGFGIGMSAFNLARARVHRREQRAKRSIEEDRKHEPSDERTRDEIEEQAERKTLPFALRRSLLWFGVVVVLLGLHTSLRFTTVQPWEPPADWMRGQFTDNPDPSQPSDEHPLEVERIAAPAYFQPGGPPYRGSFLFPLGFPNSEGGHELMDQVRQHYALENHGDVRAEALMFTPSELLDVVRDDERHGLYFTILLFLLAHVVMMYAASKAYGYAYTMIEEITGLL